MSVLAYGTTIYLFYIPNIDRENALKPISLATLQGANTNLVEQNYSIVSDGVFRVHRDYDTVSRFNYVIFKNNLANVIEYRCFIDDVRYINKEVTEVHYSVDTVSTFIGSATFLESYVEREHIAVDSIGASRTGEPVLTDIVYRQFASNTIGETERITLLFASAGYNETNAEVEEYLINGSKFYGKIFLPTNDIIQNYCNNGTSDRIIGVYSLPLSYFDRTADSQPYSNTFSNVISRPATFWGYTPKNNKCFQYPLLKMKVITTDGGNAEYTFEDFDSDVKFRLIADCSPLNDFILLLPVNYKNMGQGAYHCGISTTGVLKQSFGASTDWTVGDERQKQALIASSIFGVAGSVATMNVGGAVSTALGSANQYQELAKSDVTNQMVTGANLFKVLGIAPFRVIGDCAIREVVEIYDSYFEKYGYNTSKIKVPNTTSRTNYNYVKTRGCNVKFRGLSKYIDDFKARFDAGITLWNSSTGIGDYDL